MLLLGHCKFPVITVPKGMPRSVCVVDQKIFPLPYIFALHSIKVCPGQIEEIFSFLHSCSRVINVKEGLKITKIYMQPDFLN
ncbi:MAG: hypothetical protein CM1200mP30_25710 [Pseudomonadota bacterium]|nr:MAG: hypothetical protein CM1200mP30_25710 [Pseudomonadota bacterium]